ncbi:MAG: putative low molecular weight protein-tyrosine-phosphatase [Phycisphaerales bacterium]|nr:putative low molecular weight protein-tyrosine-phosphatase [Phycisphaerales bacterium]
MIANNPPMTTQPEHRGSPDSSPGPRRGVLFVCTGNICRSPLAEALFRHHAGRRRVIDLFDIASCGTGGWHAGDDADPRTLAVARQYGIPMRHVARQLDSTCDFDRFEWILAMDRSHMNALLPYRRPTSRLHLMREFDPACAGLAGRDLDVPDPYYGGPEGFESMYQMLDRACRGLLDHMLR